MLLMVGKGIREGRCNSVYQYAKVDNKYMEDYDKNKESSFIQYPNVNNLHCWAMSQSFQ